MAANDLARNEALYEWRSGLLVPHVRAAGPWMPNTQNGACVGALLATLAESVGDGTTLVSATIEIEFLRPILMGPLTPTVTILRSGKRLQVVRVALANGPVNAALATLVRLRPSADAPPPRHDRTGDEPVRPPAALVRLNRAGPFFEIVDCRVDRGGFDDPGPGAAWMRALAPILAGTSPSPFVAAVLAADAGSGLANIADRSQWSYPNVTLSLHMHRALQGPWIHIASDSVTGGEGIALVNSIISDESGPAGRGHQTVCITPRGEASG